MIKGDYPESAKFAEVADKVEIIVEFLNWLAGQDMAIGCWRKDADELEPVTKDIHILARESLGIDTRKLERESRAIFAEGDDNGQA